MPACDEYYARLLVSKLNVAASVPLQPTGIYYSAAGTFVSCSNSPFYNMTTPPPMFGSGLGLSVGEMWRHRSTRWKGQLFPGGGGPWQWRCPWLWVEAPGWSLFQDIAAVLCEGDRADCVNVSSPKKLCWSSPARLASPVWCWCPTKKAATSRWVHLPACYHDCLVPGGIHGETQHKQTCTFGPVSTLLKSSLAHHVVIPRWAVI